MSRLPEPCLTCGRLSTNGSRCPVHAQAKEAQWESMRQARKDETKQYAGSYRRLASIVRRTATHCHLCGQPFQRGDRIEADHLNPGTPVHSVSDLAPAHALCNARRGNKPIEPQPPAGS